MITFNRLLFLMRALFIYLGIVIVPGTLILPVTGSNLTALYSMLFWVILGIPMAFTFAFLSKDHPSAKGSFSIVHTAFGLYPCALTGWFHTFVTTLSTLIISLAGGFCFAYAFGLGELTAFITAGLILTLAVVINYFGTEITGKVQIIAGILITIGLILIVFLLRHQISGQNLVSGLSQELMSGIPQKAALLMWSLVGWDAILRLKLAFYNPKHDIFVVVSIVIFFTGLLYLGMNLAFAGSYPADYPCGTIFMVQSFVLTIPWKITIALLALIMALNATHSLVNSFGHMAFWLSHDMLAPQWLEHIHPRFSIPDRAILAFWAFGLTGLVVIYGFDLQIIKLLYAANSLTLSTLILISAAAIKHAQSITAKVLAISCLVFCLLLFIFLGKWLGVSLLVVISSSLYVYWREKRESLDY